MTPTAPTLFARSDFHQTVARLRDNIAVVADDERDATMLRLEAEVGAAARRLRDANRSGAHIITRGQTEGARATVGSDGTGPSYRDVRQAASDADRMQRHQKLAARGAALLAEIEASRPAAVAIEIPVPAQSLFSR